ncbi:hypothetical protein [Lysobacter gummosus]
MSGFSRYSATSSRKVLNWLGPSYFHCVPSGLMTSPPSAGV